VNSENDLLDGLLFLHAPLLAGLHHLAAMAVKYGSFVSYYTKAKVGMALLGFQQLIQRAQAAADRGCSGRKMQLQLLSLQMNNQQNASSKNGRSEQGTGNSCFCLYTYISDESPAAGPSPAMWICACMYACWNEPRTRP